MTYSDAPRCARCDGRASLSEAAARALANESAGRLAAFECRAGTDWHVWCPTIERVRR